PRFALDLSLLVDYIGGQSGWALGAAVPFKWGPLGAVVEYLRADTMPEEGPVTAPRRSRQGVWAALALLVWRPHLELEARYEWPADPRLAGHQLHAATVGATAYLFRGILRLQVAYTRKVHAAGDYEDDVALLGATAAY